MVVDRNALAIASIKKVILLILLILLIHPKKIVDLILAEAFAHKSSHIAIMMEIVLLAHVLEEFALDGN